MLNLAEMIFSKTGIMKEEHVQPALLLLPNLLGEQRYVEPFIPCSVSKAVGTIDGLIAESAGGARKYLSLFQTKKKSHEMPVALYKGETEEELLDFLLEPIEKGERWGLISDAGVPCIADPGAFLVHRAKQKGILVRAFVGPSSLLLALMLSGLPGQKFSFHGYIDHDPPARAKQIRHLVEVAQKEGMTQIVMEAPHRNRFLLEALLATLPETFWLTVAWDLTLPTQGVVTQKVSSWKKATPPQIDKKPALFLFALF